MGRQLSSVLTDLEGQPERLADMIAREQSNVAGRSKRKPPGGLSARRVTL